MKKASRYCISILALCGFFLVGCNNAESSSLESSVQDSSSEELSSEVSSPEESSVAGDPVLSDAQIAAIGGKNITFSGNANFGDDSEDNNAVVTVRYADGYWQGIAVITDENDEVETEQNTFYRNSDGYVVETCSPDIDNVAEIIDDYEYFDESIYVNQFGSLNASWFEYDASYSDEEGRNRFVMSESALENEDALNVEQKIFNSLCSDTISTYYANDLIHFYLFTDEANENIVSMEIYEEDEYSWDLYYTTISLDISNIGSTEIDQSIIPSAYTISESEAAYYSAFKQGLDRFDNHNYTAEIACNDYTSGNLLQDSKMQVTADGYSVVEHEYSYDDSNVQSVSSTSYYGTHEAEEGYWDYYEGSSVSSLSGSRSVFSDKWYNLPELEFAYEIFEYDAENSTSENYVFNLRQEFIDNNYSYYVVGELVYGSLYWYYEEDYGFSINVSSDGYISSISFVYDDWNNVGNAVETFSNWGSTVITSDVADFTNYSAYVFPNYTTAQIRDSDITESYTYDTIYNALVSVLGQSLADQVPDVMEADHDISSKFTGGAFSATQGIVQFYFDYFWSSYTFSDLTDGCTAIRDAFLAADSTASFGAWDEDYWTYDGTLLNGEVEVSVFIDSYYYARVQINLPQSDAE